MVGEDSLWFKRNNEAVYPVLTESSETDVIVVGAGIAGLTAAYLLKQSGLKVVVLEKELIGSGTTGHTTGKVSSQHNLCYHYLTKKHGEQTARAYGQMNQAALAKMDEIITKHHIDCDWARDDNYVYTTKPDDTKIYKDEAEAAAKLGLPAEFVTDSELPFKITGAVKFSNQAKINAAKYLLGLASLVDGSGSYVFENSRASLMIGGKHPYVKSRGKTIRAKYVLVTTKVPALPLMSRGNYCALEYPQNSYIIAGETQHQFNGMYISPDKNNYSILPMIVGGTPKLLVGGENHLPGIGGGASRHYRRLAAYAKEKFGMEQVQLQWHSRDYLGYDYLPIVGPLNPWSKRIFTATALMKWGLTNGTAAGMVLHDLTTGTDNQYSHMLRPYRASLITSIPSASLKYLQRNR